MKKTIISAGAFLIALTTLSLQSCNNEKKESAKTDSLTTIAPDTTVVDSTAALSRKSADTTDTGGRAGQKPPVVKN